MSDLPSELTITLREIEEGRWLGHCKELDIGSLGIDRQIRMVRNSGAADALYHLEKAIESAYVNQRSEKLYPSDCPGGE